MLPIPPDTTAYPPEPVFPLPPPTKLQLPEAVLKAPATTVACVAVAAFGVREQPPPPTNE
jgi:hypothetical protein